MKNKQASILFIFFTFFIDILGMAVIIPVMPSLLEEVLHVDVSEASFYGAWLITAYAVMQFVFSPILGSLSDRYGRRPVLLIALAGLCLNYMILYFAPSFGWLLAGRLLSGIAGASISTCNAYIADVSAPEERTKNFGYVGVAFGLGFIIGPLIGGLAGDISPRAPFVVSAILTLINFLFGLFILPESLKPENRRAFNWKRANPISAIANLRKHPVVSQLSLSLFFIYMASHAVQATWSYYTAYKFDWNEKMVGISLGVFGVLSMAVQGLLIKVAIKKFGAVKSILIGGIHYAVGLLLYAFANEGWMMFGISVLYCLGGIVGPSLQGLMSAQTPPNRQGELQGALTSIMSISAVFGPMLMMNLFHQFSGKDAIYPFPGMPFLVGAIFMVLAIIFVLPFLKNVRISAGMQEK